MKKLISLFLSVLMCLNLFSGMVFAAPAADSDSEIITEVTEFNGTQDLIQQTIKNLIAAGKIVTDVDKPSDALIAKVEKSSGLSFDTVKTEIATALSENRTEGKIDISRFNLSRNDAAEVMEWVLKDFYLVHAVTDVKYVTDASGIAVEFRYVMSDGMNAALDEMQEEKEYFEENYDMAEGEAVAEEVVLESIDKKDFLAAVKAAEENGDVSASEEATDSDADVKEETGTTPDESTTAETTTAETTTAETTTAETTTAETTTAETTTAETTTAETTTAETTTEPTTVAPTPACTMHTVGYGFDEASQQYYALVNATWEMVKTVGELAADYSNAELVFDPETGDVSVSAPTTISYTCTSVAFECAACGAVVSYVYDASQGQNNAIINAGEQTIYYDLRTGEAVTEKPSGEENVDWVNYTNYAIAVFPDDNSFDATGNIDSSKMVTVMHDAGQARVEYYYNMMSSFNALNADLFGVSAPYWTSKNTESNPMAAVKVLCNMKADDQVPPNAMIQMVQMLPQAFMSYVMNYESQLLAMKDLAMAEIDKLPSSATDVQKLLVLHDWLAEHATFDMGSLNDAANAANDPIQMTTFGAVLSYQLDDYFGGICLAYAAAYNWLIQWAFPEYYQKNGKFLSASEADHIIDFVQIKFFADTNETSVAGAGFGGGYFNNVHYFNAVRLPDPTVSRNPEKHWFYVDVCYDDISVECISQYRVEAEGNLSHMNFLTSPQTIESLYKSSTEYIDSLYDGYTYVITDTPSTDSDGNILYNEDGSIHYEYEKVTNPDETAYDNACYEDTWFSGAVSPIEFDGKNWYYVDSGNTYVAYKDYIDEEGDFDIGNMGGGDYDMGEIMHDNRVDPANADKLKVRAISAPDYYTSNNNNNNNNMMGQSEKTDPYAEVLIKYGFGHVATNIPTLLSKAGDKNVDAVYDGQSEGDSENEYAGMTGMILEECQKDFAMNELYPGLVHTISLYDNVIYFNLANKIVTLDLETGEIGQLKEYNEVYAVSQAGHNFKGASYRAVAADSENIEIKVKNRPLASFAIRDNVVFEAVYGEYNGEYYIAGYNTTVTPTIVSSIATNLAYSYPLKSGSDSEFDSYTKEASNYNPDYQRGVSDDDSNDNAEFLWCANIREEMPLLAVLDEYVLLKSEEGLESESVVSVTVDEWCDEAAFTELRTATYGLSDGSTKEYINESATHHFEKSEDDVYVCRHCLNVESNAQTAKNSNPNKAFFTWEDDVCTSATVKCYYNDCSVAGSKTEFTADQITNTVGTNTRTASVKLSDGTTYTDYRAINKGDIDGDDKINVLDIASLITYLSGESSTYKHTLADINDDGIIDEVDLSALRTILTGVSAETTTETSNLSIVATADPDSLMVDESGKATFDVVIEITGVNENNNVSIMDISLAYDSDLISLVSIADGTLMVVANNTENALLFETENIFENITEDGILATITFELTGEITERENLAIDVSVDSAARYNSRKSAFELISIATGSAAVLLKPYCPHTESTIVNTLEPTCTENGYTGDKQCNACGDIIENGEAIPAVGHTLNVINPAIPATCTEDGFSGDMFCEVCDYEVTGHVVPATGHTEEIIASIPATCTEKGYTEGKKCPACNIVLAEQAEVPATGHTEVIDAGVAATCTTAGMTEGKHCSECSIILVAQEKINALGHDMIITPYKAPTCTEEGLEKGEYCSRCDDVTVEQTKIPALGHDMVAVEYLAPTCTVNGHTAGELCSRCDYTAAGAEILPAPGHTITVISAVAATCTTSGITEGQYCSVCDEAVVPQEVVPARGHNMVVMEAVAATCTTDGLTEGGYCTRCNDATVMQKIIPALGHNIVIDKAVAATCSKTGLTEGQHCSRCDDKTVKQETVAKTGHKEVTVKGKAATCSEKGLTDGKKCSVCNKVTVAQKSINVIAHKEVTVKGKAATCTTKGLTDGKKCSVCNKVTVAQKEIATTGHKYSEWSQVKAPTLTEVGLEVRTCSVCKDKQSRDIAKLDYLAGDANGDKKVNAADARIALRISAKLDSFENYKVPFAAIDVNNDGKITANDARKILRKSANLE